MQEQSIKIIGAVSWTLSHGIWQLYVNPKHNPPIFMLWLLGLSYELTSVWYVTGLRELKFNDNRIEIFPASLDAEAVAKVCFFQLLQVGLLNSSLKVKLCLPASLY